MARLIPQKSGGGPTTYFKSIFVSLERFCVKSFKIHHFREKIHPPSTLTDGRDWGYPPLFGIFHIFDLFYPYIMPSKDEPSKKGNFDFCRGEDEEEEENKKTSRGGRRRWGRWRRRRDSTGVCAFAANGVPPVRRPCQSLREGEALLSVQRGTQEGDVVIPPLLLSRQSRTKSWVRERENLQASQLLKVPKVPTFVRSNLCTTTVYLVGRYLLSMQ